MHKLKAHGRIDGQSSWKRDPLEAILMFKRGKDPAHATLRRVVTRLEKAGLMHAVMGGLAVAAHGHERMTDDVDLLMTKPGFLEFKKLFVPKFYEPVPGRPRRFIDRANGVILDILVTGLFPGGGQPGPIAFPDPGLVQQQIKKIRFINLPTLIQLKLAARRYQDFADVVSLIRVHNLDESFLDQLHKTLHSDFIECLEEHRRELEYEAQP